MLKLFFAPNTIAVASLITLHECQVDFEKITLDFQSAGQRAPEYLNINPKGRVPALVTKQGILTETPAILVYLAQQNPAADLLPKTPFAFAQLQSFNSYLASTVHVNHAHKLRGKRWVTEQASMADMQARVPHTMLESFQLIERDYLQGPWVMGEQYTVADAYLYSIALWLEGDGVDLSLLPKTAKFIERMNDRPAVQRAFSS